MIVNILGIRRTASRASVVCVNTSGRRMVAGQLLEGLDNILELGRLNPSICTRVYEAIIYRVEVDR